MWTGLAFVCACGSYSATPGFYGVLMMGTGANLSQVGPATDLFRIQVNVVGLTGSTTPLVLQNNGADNLSITADGAASFTTGWPSGTSYSVTVLTQPTGPAKVCLVSGGTGTIVSGDVSSITINCTSGYTVGGNISGLAGTGLVLQNNAGDNLTLSANGAFAFATPIANGGAYAVTVLTQPAGPTQTCVVTSGAGVIAGANITAVNINCTTNTYTVGVSVSGLIGFAGLVLQNNAGDNLNIAANGAANFATPVASGAAYAVTVLSAPAGETCTVTSGSGTIASANITGIAVTCAATTYSIGGTATGLAGSGLVLQNNGGDNLSVTTNGAFQFATSIANASAYVVTVLTQPSTPTQTCSLQNSGGTVAAANVTNLQLNCVTANIVGGSIPIVPVFTATPQLTTHSGNGSFGTVDGAAGTARFAGPRRITTDGTNLYTIESASNAVRQVSIATGAASTITLTPSNPLNQPRGVTTDGTSLFITSNASNLVHRVIIATGAVSVMAGGNSGGGTLCAGSNNANCRDGVGTAAEFNGPEGITSDGNFLYVADSGNNRIRRISIATQAVTTLAGDGSTPIISGPKDMTTDATNLYVADNGNNRVLRIPIATGVPTTLFAITGARGITTDGTNLYMTTDDHRLQMYNSINTGGTLTSIAGAAGVDAYVNGTANTVARMDSPNGVTNDGDALYISDTRNWVIRKYK
ncbi:MAG: hypothetical protein NXI24_08055 [bacterium]|nr:hypothetical protein [bacterium]